ncbi:cytoplasmic tRNA 2-thiolation protein 2-A isoform X2 [Bacillus rossius redtenbacheri]
MCRKCSQVKADVNLRVKDAYCRECFLLTCTHKFRAELGKSKLMRAHDHGLVAHSGGQSSSALLHLVWAGLRGHSHKKLFFRASVLYVDEGAVLAQSLEERRRICSDVRERVEKLGFPFYVATLSSALQRNETSDPGSELRVDPGADAELSNLVESARELTAKEDLLQKLRNNLIVSVGEHLKCTKVFLAENCDQIATKILANVSLGRGAQLPLDVGFCNNLRSGMQILRPLRTFSKKEVAFYNLYNKLETVTIPSLQTKLDSHASIQRLTERFVAELQENFPATVSTVFRTGDKLAGQRCHEADESCALCQGCLDTKEQQSSALQATNFSRLVSTLGPSGFAGGSVEASPAAGNVRPAGDSCECSGRCSPGVSRQDVNHALCYGCRLIVNSMAVLDHLPQNVLSTARKKVALGEMRKEIENFLL